VASDQAFLKIATNRRAFHDYHVLERFEAGVVLTGTEVKSIRDGKITIAGSYATLDDGAVVLHNLNIPPYGHGNRFNHDPMRPRRLLVHRRELEKLRTHIEQKGHALVPLGINIKRGWVKVEMGLCRGKQQADKREAIRKKDANREAARAMSRG
jgi:SsrA-binding protein